MAPRLSRTGVLVTALALLATACGGSNASQAPSGGTTASTEPSVAASTAPSTTTSTAPGEKVEIRWYCCLGGGEAPEQKTVEDKVVGDWNAAHPDIHLTLEVVTYDQANGQLATELQSGNG